MERDVRGAAVLNGVAGDGAQTLGRVLVDVPENLKPVSVDKKHDELNAGQGGADGLALLVSDEDRNGHARIVQNGTPTMKARRLGVIRLTDEAKSSAPWAADLNILEARVCFDQFAMDWLCEHPDFDPVLPGGHIPRYYVTQLEDGKFKWESSPARR